MSANDIAARPAPETKSDVIIVFDHINKTLTTEKLKELDMTKAISRMPAPRWENRVDLYFKRNDSDTERLIATLDLDKLGYKTKLKRACGEISEICAMNLKEGRLNGLSN